METLTIQNLFTLFRGQSKPGAVARTILLLVGVILTPITLAGALWGYVRGYNRFQINQHQQRPEFSNMPGIVIASMVIFAILGWVLIFVVGWLAASFLENVMGSSLKTRVFLGFFLVNILLTMAAFAIFRRWQIKTTNIKIEDGRHGTAMLAPADSFTDLLNKPGLSIGGSYSYFEKGHILTVGATRSGKGANLVIPALLDARPYEGSLVVIDPKGENAAITGRYQANKGQNVLLLDPWKLQTQHPTTYDPLDILKMGNDLGDDASMIAEMIVPADPSERDKFFSDRARSIIAGMIIHIKLNGGTLVDLWKYLRSSPDDWLKLVAKMQSSPDHIVSATGNEIESSMKSDKMFSSIMASALQNTDFLKSPALQTSLLKSSFDVTRLTKDATTLYIIIPADKLKSHYQYLRLVVATSMRAVVRNYNKNMRVTFVLDEFAVLGPLKEVSEFGLSTAAGYNLSLWMILQSLPQLQTLYGDNWQNFIANTNVKQWVGVMDNFTADYVSHSLGANGFLTFQTDTGEVMSNTPRPVLNPEEVRSTTADRMIVQIEQRQTSIIHKQPYYKNPELVGRYDPNPYI